MLQLPLLLTPLDYNSVTEGHRFNLSPTLRIDPPRARDGLYGPGTLYGCCPVQEGLGRASTLEDNRVILNATFPCDLAVAGP
jgi:hypothetical protein